MKRKYWSCLFLIVLVSIWACESQTDPHDPAGKTGIVSKNDAAMTVAIMDTSTGKYALEVPESAWRNHFRSCYPRERAISFEGDTLGIRIVNKLDRYYLSTYAKDTYMDREVFLRIEVQEKGNLLILHTWDQCKLLMSYCESQRYRMQPLPWRGCGPCFRILEDNTLDPEDRCVKVTERYGFEE